MAALEAEMKGEGKEGRKMSTFVGLWLQSSWQMGRRQWIPAEWMATEVTKQQNHQRWRDDKCFTEFIFFKKVKKENIIIKICTFKIQDIFSRLSARQFARLTRSSKRTWKAFHAYAMPRPRLFFPPIGVLSSCPWWGSSNTGEKRN